MEEEDKDNNQGVLPNEGASLNATKAEAAEEQALREEKQHSWIMLTTSPDNNPEDPRRLQYKNGQTPPSRVDRQPKLEDNMQLLLS